MRAVLTARAAVILFLLGASACADLLAAPRKVEANGRHFFIGAPPSWVARQSPAPLPSNPGGSDRSLVYLLGDHQVLAGDGPIERYGRFVVVPMERAGLANASQIEIVFNPDYETLTLHELAIVRAGKRIDKLNADEVRLIQRETALDQSVLDGATTAVIMLSDVRVGDQIDYSFSIKGSNPVLGDKLMYSLSVAYPVWVGALHIRLRAASHRHIAHRVHGLSTAPETRQEGGFKDLVWRFNPAPLVAQEDAVPDWHFPSAWLQISEYRQWSEVADWARKLFEFTAIPLAPELEQRLATWAALPQPADRVRAALDFVQQEIRYLAISLGENSHRPQHPNVVLERRYGDCKDKSLLLTTLLRRLGFEANPALVSLQLRRGVEHTLPSSGAFDHVIVQVKLSGATYWLDPTRAYQNGALEARGVTDFGRALVVAKGSADLVPVELPAGYRNAVHVEERITLKDFAAPASLELITTYLGDDAENLRATFAKRSLDEVSKRSHEFMSKRYPGIASTGPLRVDERQDNGAITIKEVYAVPRLLEYRDLRVSGTLEPWALLEYVRLPQVVNRKAPLAQAYPMSARHTFVVELPHDPGFKPGEGLALRDAALSYRFHPSYRDRRITLAYELTTLADAVKPQDLSLHLMNRRKILDNQYYRFSVPVVSAAESAAASREVQRADPKRASAQEVSSAAKSRHRARVRLLSSIIDGRTLQGDNLAQAYAERADVLSNLHQLASAFADVEKSIALQPSRPEFFLLRGQLNTKAGNFEAALRDFETAEGLQAERGSLSTSRGYALYYLGRYDEAAVEFERSLEHGAEAQAPLRLLWLHMARLRAGQGADSVRAHLQRLTTREWPRDALEVFLRDRVDVAVVIALARHPDRTIEQLQLCEAYFYVGQYYLARNERERAREMFERTVETDIGEYIEDGFARLELQRLGALQSR